MRSQHLSIGHARLLLPGLAIALLVACGGGGGGGDGGAPSPPPSAQGNGSLVITSANQKAVAADALDTATDITAALLGTSLMTGVQVSSTAHSQRVDLPSLTLRLIELVVPPPALATGVALNQPLACKSGSGRVTGTIASTNAVTTGDVMTFTTSNCTVTVGSEPTSLDGALSVTVVAGGYDKVSPTYPIRIVMAIAASALRVTTGGLTDVINGDERVDLTQSSATTGTMDLSGASLGRSMTRNGVTHQSTLLDYQQRLTLDGARMSNDMRGNVQTNNPRLGDVRYSMRTTSPLVVTSGVFTTGSLLVAGAPSMLLASVSGPDAFALSLDADGDGSFEASTPTTTAELLSLL